MVEVEGRFFYLAKYLCRCGPLERKIPAQYCVEQNSQRPHVSLCSLSPTEHFRRHIKGRPYNCMKIAVLGCLVDAEVNNLYLLFFCSHIHENVFGFQIPVHDAILMEIANGVK